MCAPLCFGSLYTKTRWTYHLWRDHRPVKPSPQTENRPTGCIHHCRTKTGETRQNFQRFSMIHWLCESKKKLNNVCVKMFSDTMLLCRTSPLEKNLTRLQFIIQGVSLERYLTDATLEDTYDRTKFTPILSPSDSLTARKWLCALCYGKQSKTELPIMCKRKSVNAVMLHNCPCATF